MSRTKTATQVAYAALGLVLLVAVIAGLNWAETEKFVRNHEPILKFIGLVVAPMLALIGFLFGRIDKAELKDLTSRYGAARASAREAKRQVDAVLSDVAKKEARITQLTADLAKVADANRAWTIRANRPFVEYKGWKYDPVGAKIVTTALFKGGVGKTHLTANFAAYVSEKQHKPVLIVDLDYQGSLSTTLLISAGIEPKGSLVDLLFQPDANLETLGRAKVHLARTGDDTSLNGGKGMSRAWLVPADYTLAELESRLLVERVVNQPDVLDERYRLARILLNPAVRREFALILIDTPPRMTLGTVNALVASHCIVIPTILDRISSEAVVPFIEQVRLLKDELELDLKLAGVVASMTRHTSLSTTREVPLRDATEARLTELLGPTAYTYFIDQPLPRKAQVTDSQDLGYFLADNTGPLAARFYDSIFDELWTRIMGATESV